MTLKSVRSSGRKRSGRRGEENSRLVEWNLSRSCSYLYCTYRSFFRTLSRLLAQGSPAALCVASACDDTRGGFAPLGAEPLIWRTSKPKWTSPPEQRCSLNFITRKWSGGSWGPTSTGSTCSRDDWPSTWRWAHPPTALSLICAFCLSPLLVVFHATRHCRSGWRAERILGLESSRPLPCGFQCQLISLLAVSASCGLL